MKGCFFGKKPAAELEFVLKVLDCSDLQELAVMYGEARNGFRNPDLQRVANDRMKSVIQSEEQLRNNSAQQE